MTKVQIEDVLPVQISLDAPCKGCRLGFFREQNAGKFWHVWEGRAYPCTNDPSHLAEAQAEP
jgi:hypothetical protein